MVTVVVSILVEVTSKFERTKLVIFYYLFSISASLLCILVNLGCVTFQKCGYITKSLFLNFESADSFFPSKKVEVSALSLKSKPVAKNANHPRQHTCIKKDTKNYLN